MYMKKYIVATNGGICEHELNYTIYRICKHEPNSPISGGNTPFHQERIVVYYLSQSPATRLEAPPAGLPPIAPTLGLPVAWRPASHRSDARRTNRPACISPMQGVPVAQPHSGQAVRRTASSNPLVRHECTRRPASHRSDKWRTCKKIVSQNTPLTV